MNFEQQAAANSLLSLTQINETDAGLILLVGIVVTIILVCLLAGSARFLHHFSKELQYLNMEIKRTDGEERRYYLCQRRRLWLSLLPFMKY